MREGETPPHLVRRGNQGMGYFTDLSVLITGGSGSLGHQLVEQILPQHPERLIIFSRDEWKQNEMRQRWPDNPGASIRYFIGDVRDKDRLHRAFTRVDVVIHAAAMKQIGSCEYNPWEAVKTNVLGSQNVIEAAIDREVNRVLFISSDKACSPAQLYGTSKKISEHLAIQANAYSPDGTKFSVCRYGNVVGSRGSVVPLFQKQKLTGTLTVTDPRMTRFWMTLPEAFNLIQHALTHMRGGEIFIPKIPSMRILDLTQAIAPKAQIKVTGIRPGEKLHEALLSPDEIHHTVDTGEVYVVQPLHPWWTTRTGEGQPLPEGFQYTSDVNPWFLTVDELRAKLAYAPEGVTA